MLGFHLFTFGGILGIDFFLSTSFLTSWLSSFQPLSHFPLVKDVSCREKIPLIRPRSASSALSCFHRISPLLTPVLSPPSPFYFSGFFFSFERTTNSLNAFFLFRLFFHPHFHRINYWRIIALAEKTPFFMTSCLFFPTRAGISLSPTLAAVVMVAVDGIGRQISVFNALGIFSGIVIVLPYKPLCLCLISD